MKVINPANACGSVPVVPRKGFPVADTANQALEVKAFSRAKNRTGMLGQITPVFLHSELVDAKRACAFAAHIHSSYELIVVTKGQYRCRLNGQDLTLPPNRALLVKPGDRHEDFYDKGLRYFEMMFSLDIASGDATPRTIFNDAVPPSAQHFVDSTGACLELVERIRQEIETADRYFSFVADALLGALFWHVVRSLPAKAVRDDFIEMSAFNDFAGRLLRIFHENLGANLSLHKIAAKMGVSESLLVKKCGKLLGISPAKAFLKCKMDQAFHLLTTADMRVGEVSGQLGFKNQYHFSRVFKKYHRRAPSALKRAAPFVLE